MPITATVHGPWWGTTRMFHVCFCTTNRVSADGTKVDVAVPGGWWGWRVRSEGRVDADSLYAGKVVAEFEPRIRTFEPELIFWYFGFDTYEGDYGSLGLSKRCYLEIARFMKAIAHEVTEDRLEVVLGGGSRTDIATRVIPPIIGILAD